MAVLRELSGIRSPDAPVFSQRQYPGRTTVTERLRVGLGDLTRIGFVGVFVGISRKLRKTGCHHKMLADRRPAHPPSITRP